MDDGDILCHPILVQSNLHEFDNANGQIGAERNPQKTEAILYVEDLNAAPPEWKIEEVVADQLLGKADVLRAMHERVRLCQDPQTELALCRESLGVNRVNHIVRVHGHTILYERRVRNWVQEGT